MTISTKRHNQNIIRFNFDQKEHNFEIIKRDRVSF